VTEYEDHQVRAVRGRSRGSRLKPARRPQNGMKRHHDSRTRRPAAKPLLTKTRRQRSWLLSGSGRFLLRRGRPEVLRRRAQSWRAHQGLFADKACTVPILDIRAGLDAGLDHRRQRGVVAGRRPASSLAVGRGLGARGRGRRPSTMGLHTRRASAQTGALPTTCHGSSASPRTKELIA